MTITFHSSTNANIQSVLGFLAQALALDVDLEHSSSFDIKLECRDGKTLSARVIPLDQGLVMRTTKAGEDLVVPTGGAPDLDGTYGTATLVASTVDVTVTTPDTGGAAVPVGSVVLATVTTGAGVTKLLSAVRLSNTQIRISSPGSGYGSVLSSAGVDGTLVAGEKANIALANVAGDLLAVKEKTPGGSAADHFSIVRVDNSNVKVQAHNSAGALVAGNTSVVTAFNMGQPAHETSLVRWAVIRP